MNKVVIVLVSIGLIASLAFLALPITVKQFVDNEVIGDDGFYARLKDVDCQSGAKVRFLLSLSPVRSNRYNACQLVDINLKLSISDDKHVNSRYLWGADNCQSEDIRSEYIQIDLTELVGKSDLINLCDNSQNVSLAFMEYRLTPLPESIIMPKTSDPLGQQARLDSSIPEKETAQGNSKDLNSFFSDKANILLIQKKLVLISDYGGPLDGIWNSEMDDKIRDIQADNVVLYEKTQSLSTLFLLGFEM